MMKKATFNNLITIEYPDDFVELSPEENAKFFAGNFPRLSLHNKEKHILLSLSKNKDSFINRFVSIKTTANGALSTLAKNLKDYQFIGSYKSTIFNENAITECFSYSANDQDIKQYAELSVFKVKKAFYILYSLSRLDDKEEAKKIFEIIVDSFKS